MRIAIRQKAVANCEGLEFFHPRRAMAKIVLTSPSTQNKGIKMMVSGWV